MVMMVRYSSAARRTPVRMALAPPLPVQAHVPPDQAKATKDAPLRAVLRTIAQVATVVRPQEQVNVHRREAVEEPRAKGHAGRAWEDARLGTRPVAQVRPALPNDRQVHVKVAVMVIAPSAKGQGGLAQNGRTVKAQEAAIARAAQDPVAHPSDRLVRAKEAVMVTVPTAKAQAVHGRSAPIPKVLGAPTDRAAHAPLAAMMASVRSVLPSTGHPKATEDGPPASQHGPNAIWAQAARLPRMA